MEFEKILEFQEPDLCSAEIASSPMETLQKHLSQSTIDLTSQCGAYNSVTDFSVLSIPAEAQNVSCLGFMIGIFT